MKLRVMEYNVLNGFFDEIEEDVFKFNKERAQCALKIVKQFDPDILVLCEASFSPVHAEKAKKLGVNINEYAKLFGYENCFYGKRTKRDGSALLSKYPLEAEDYSIDTVSFIRARFNIGQNSLMLDVFHPHPTKISNAGKMNFVKSILRGRKEPYILCGDFNSVSPEDMYDFKTLEKGFTLLVGKGDASGVVKDILSARTIRYVLEEGLIDSYKKLNKKTSFTCPTKLFEKEKDTSMRLDFIFCSRDIKVLESGIIKNKLSDKASDHYPIYSILEIGGR